MRVTVLRKLILFTAPFLVLLFLFQNCTKSLDFSAQSNEALTTSAATSAAPGSGHGDSYDGKPTAYELSDLTAQCSETSRLGRPLPNSQIFVYPSKAAYLVREKCKDIVPIAIAASELTFALGKITYRGHVYSERTPADMELLVANCPAGLTPIPNAPRANMLLQPVDLLGPNWGSLGGVDVKLEGSLASYPAYRISKTVDDNYHRLDQYLNLSANTSYSFSLFLRKGTSNQAAIFFYDNSVLETGLRIDVDLTTGVISPVDSLNLSNISLTSRPFADGQFVSVFFTTPNIVRGLDMGVASTATAVGSSIFAADVQVEPVASYCR